MELLKAYVMGHSMVEVDNTLQWALTTKSFGTTAISMDEPTVLVFYRRQVIITTSGQAVGFEPIEYDLTDGAGHGILVATDNVFGQIVAAGTSVANTVRVKLMYRMKNVSLAEYVGIVQSQQ